MALTLPSDLGQVPDAPATLLGKRGSGQRPRATLVLGFTLSPGQRQEAHDRGRQFCPHSGSGSPAMSLAQPGPG